MNTTGNKPTKSSSLANILKILAIVLILAIFALLLMEDESMNTLIGILLIASIILFFQSGKINRKIRIEKYTEFISTTHIMSIPEIAKHTAKQPKVVRDDVQKAINNRTLKDTYFDRANDIVVMGAENISRYKAAGNVNEPVKSTVAAPSISHCPNCGAPVYNQGGTCEYCGAAIK
jgi:hypothetical protein